MPSGPRKCSDWNPKRKCKSLYTSNATFVPENMDWLGHDRHSPRLHSYLGITRYASIGRSAHAVGKRNVRIQRSGLIAVYCSIVLTSRKPICRSEMSAPSVDQFRAIKGRPMRSCTSEIRILTEDYIIGQPEIRCVDV